VSVCLLVAGVAVAEPRATTTPGRLSLAELSACNGSTEAPVAAFAAETAALRADRQAHRTGRRIAEYRGQARRHRQRLVIGRAVLLDRTIDVDTGDGVIRSFVGRYGRSPVVLVAQTFFESSNYLLVDTASGDSLVTGGAPVRGPGGRVFAATTRSEGYSEPSVEIVEWRNGRFFFVRFDIRACGLAWDGPERLTYRSGFSGGAAGAIERRDGHWFDRGAGGAAPAVAAGGQ
jgi:hypothetical protein